MIYGAQLALMRSYQGRSDEVIEMLEESSAAYPGIPAWRAGLATTYCWLDRRPEAAAIVQEAARDGFEHVQWDQIRLDALALYADAASQASVADAAAVLYELIKPWADRVVWNGASGYGHARTYLGLLAATLGWDDRADEHFKFACEFHERHDMPLWAARAYLGWAEALAARGEQNRAQKEAARALELSREHGYGTFEARAAAIVEMGAPAQT
jgi:ATP/maltotriose-dependent transcriptional regulator MalT